MADCVSTHLWCTTTWRTTLSELSIRDMLAAGVHFGHRARYWNPKMAPLHIRCAESCAHHPPRPYPSRDERSLGGYTGDGRAETEDPFCRHETRRPARNSRTSSARRYALC